MPKLNSSQLRSYQDSGIEYLAATKRCCLWDEPGLGKSAQLIRASRGRSLVISTAMVADNVWPTEIAKWADDSSRFTITSFSRLVEREKGPKGGAKPTKVIPEWLKDEQWDTVIIDEHHNITSRSAYWIDAVKEITSTVDRVYMATGTPITKWASGLFTTLQVLDPIDSKPGKRLGSYWRWAKEFFDTSPNRFSRGLPAIGDLLGCTKTCSLRPLWDPCQHYQNFCKANLGGRFIQRLRDDVLPDLPPITIQVIPTPMSREQRRLYNALKKDYVTWANNSEIAAFNDGALNAKLAMLCVGPEVLGLPIQGGKMARLKHDLENRSRPTLVAGHYKKTLYACENVATQLGLRTGVINSDVTQAKIRHILEDFHDGKVDVLIGNYDMLGEGLTLVEADVGIRVEPSYKHYRNDQFINRIHRMGQERPTTILDYVTPNSLDEHRLEALEFISGHSRRIQNAAHMAKLL